MARLPGGDDIAGELRALQRQISELSRSSAQGAICVVRLNVDVSLGAATNVVPVTSWKSTAEVDTHSMYRYNTGGQTYVQLPFAGRWYARLTGIYPTAGTAGRTCTCAILLNSTAASASSVVAGDSLSHSVASANTSPTAICEDRIFAAGDKLYMNFWRSDSAVTLAASDFGSYTHFVIRYLGPN